MDDKETFLQITEIPQDVGEYFLLLYLEKILDSDEIAVTYVEGSGIATACVKRPTIDIQTVRLESFKKPLNDRIIGISILEQRDIPTEYAASPADTKRTEDTEDFSSTVDWALKFPETSRPPLLSDSSEPNINVAQQQQWQNISLTTPKTKSDEYQEEAISIPSSKWKSVAARLHDMDEAEDFHMDRESLTVTVKGTKAKLSVYEILATIVEVPLPGMSSELACLLCTVEGEHALNEKDIHGTLFLRENLVYIALDSVKEKVTVEKLNVLSKKIELPFVEDHEAYIQSEEWKTLNEKLTQKFLVVTKVDMPERKIFVSGIDVDLAVLEINDKLKQNATITDFMSITSGAGRYIEIHGQQFLWKLEREINADISIKPGCQWRIELSGHVNALGRAKSLLQKFIGGLKYGKKEIVQPGIRSVFTSSSGKHILRGLEMNYTCVIEFQNGDGHTSSFLIKGDTDVREVDQGASVKTHNSSGPDWAGLVFHVHAMTEELISQAFSEINQHFEDSVCEDTVKRDGLDNILEVFPSTIQQLESFNTDEVAVAIDTKKGIIRLSGLYKAVMACRKQIMTLSFPSLVAVIPGIGRYIASHETDRIKHWERETHTNISIKQGHQWEISISGEQGGMDTAKLLLLEFVNRLVIERKEINRAGTRAVYRSSSGRHILQGIETSQNCVIETEDGSDPKPPLVIDRDADVHSSLEAMWHPFKFGKEHERRSCPRPLATSEESKEKLIFGHRGVSRLASYDMGIYQRPKTDFKLQKDRVNETFEEEGEGEYDSTEEDVVYSTGQLTRNIDRRGASAAEEDEEEESGAEDEEEEDEEEEEFSFVHGEAFAGAVPDATTKTVSACAGLVFHVYAKTTVTIRRALLEIDQHLNESLSEDPVKLYQTPSKRTLANLEALNSDKVNVTFDPKTVTIKLAGVSNAVIACRKYMTLLLDKNERHSLSSDRQKLLGMADDTSTVPNHWTKYNPKKMKGKLAGKSYEPGLVDAKSSMEKAVKKVLEKSWRADLVGKGNDAINLNHKSLIVKKVERVENPRLWQDYNNKRKQLLLEAAVGSRKFPAIDGLDREPEVQTCSFKVSDLDKLVEKGINEVFLFHGTTDERREAVVLQGLDSRLGESRGMFGQGVYFAESSTKADQYADPKHARTGGDHYMILARVLLGNPFVCHKPEKMQRPPCTTCMKADCRIHGEFFDSVIGIKHDGGTRLLFREFVVYDKGMCYPEFVITYERRSLFAE